MSAGSGNYVFNLLKELSAAPRARWRLASACFFTALALIGGIWAYPLAIVAVVVWCAIERRAVAQAARTTASALSTAGEYLGSLLLGAARRLRESVLGRVFGYVFAALWIALCCYYIASPRPPYEFFADVGGYISSVGRMGAVVASPQDLVAMLGWQTWYDAPAFVLWPLGTAFATLPAEFALNDPFRAIKVAQVLQLSLAFISAAWLYVTLFGRSPWRWLAAWIYTAMPFCSLAVRGEPDFGSTYVIVPLALAAGVALTRRFGRPALFAAGTLCATVAVFDIEHLITIGVPLLVLTLAFVRRDGTRIRARDAGLALLGFSLFPAFVVLPTSIGPHPIWFTTTYLAELRDQSVLALYSQGVFEQIAGIMRENLLSQVAGVNASSSMGYALVAGAAAWALCLAIVGVAVRRARPWLWVAIVVAGFCGLAAFGPAVPFLGPVLWNVISKIPVLDALRTPDRLAQILGLLVALAAARCAATVTAQAVKWLPLVAVACVLSAGGYLLFDVHESILGFGSMSKQLPDQEKISALARSLGGRTVVLGFSRDGSLFDFPPYAPRNPTVSFGWDLAARFAGTDAGVALLRRAAVNSIVTTPPWTVNSEAGGPPDMAIPVSSSPFARQAAHFPAGGRVFSVEPARGMTTRVNPLCTFAGPFAFNAVAGLATFEDAALVHGAHDGCTRTLFGDYDPLDEVLPRIATATWSGVQAFGQGEPMLPDYRFGIDRFAVAAPWYRRAYSGDSLLSNDPFAISSDWFSPTLTYTIAAPGSYTLWVRAAGLGDLVTLDGRDREIVASCERTTGFEWVPLRLGALKPGFGMLRIRVTRPDESTEQFVADEVVLVSDSALARSNLEQSDATVLTARAFSPNLQSHGSRTYLFPRVQVGTASVEGQGIDVDAQTAVGIFNGEMEARSSAPFARIRFPWNGPSGRYAVTASAWLSGLGAVLSVASGGEIASASYDVALVGRPTTLFAPLDLRHGQPLDVIMRSSPDSSAGNALEQILAAPVQAEQSPTGYNDRSESWRLSASSPLEFFAALHAPDLSVRSNGVAGPVGASAFVPFRPDFFGGTATATIVGTGALGEARLECGSFARSGAFGSATANPTGIKLSVAREGSTPCRLRIDWRSSDMALQRIELNGAATVKTAWTANQYFSSGNYRWTSAQTRGIELAVDGRGWRAGSIARLSSGFHRVELRRAPVPTAPLEFFEAGVWDRSVPAKTTVELAQIDDGYWSARAGASQVRGYPCDLVNTCFDLAGTGPVQIVRRFPQSLLAGYALTLLGIAIAAILLIVNGRQR